MDHSLLQPSNAAQWVFCPGSVQMNLLTGPKPSNEQASEGRIVHEIAAELVEGVTRAQLPGRASSKLWDTTRNGVYVTKEMVDSALMYAKHIERLIQYTRVFGGPHLAIERRVEIPDIHETCFGTPDFWIYDKGEDHLTVYDLKYGFGPVEAFENWQALCYVNGIISELGFTPAKVTIVIVQPRAPHKNGPIRSWNINDTSTLEPYFKRLRDAANMAMGSNAQTCTGPHCRYCPSILTCETRRTVDHSVIDLVSGLNRTETNNNSLWFELYILERCEKALKHRIEALKSEVEAKLRSGTKVPYYKMKDKFSRPFWTIPHEQILQLGKMHGVDLNVQKTLTPKQACDAGIPKELVDTMTKTEKRGVKLEFDDLAQARFVFNQPS